MNSIEGIDQISTYFEKSNLIPAIIQEATSGQVLMLAYMNEESLAKTLETGETWFFSRSRQALWHKGESSGNTQQVVDIFGDCDYDTLLIRVIQKGPACHTGEKSCFFRPLQFSEQTGNLSEPFHQLFQVIQQRKKEKQEGSYTCYLFEQGIDKILKKCGEEASEVIIAAKNQDLKELENELVDLQYHLMVLMAAMDLPYEALTSEILRRSQKIGNLKNFHNVDKAT